MTVVNLRGLATTLGGAQNLTKGAVQVTAWAATGPYIAVQGADVTFPHTIIVPIVDGVPATPVDLEPTDGRFCWRWEVIDSVRGNRLPPRFTTVPANGPVDFGDLQDVDPTTLSPVAPDVITGWEAATQQITADMAVQVSAAEQAKLDAQSALAGMQKGQPDGVADLDGSGRLPEARVPERLTEDRLSATYSQASLSMHWARHAEIKRRKGGVIGTEGKSVIAFQVAHQLDEFKATIWPEFRSRGIPVGWGAVTGAVGDPTDIYEPTNATWADVRKHFYEGAEVWAHSRTHLEPQPIGTDGGDTIQGEIQGAREDIEAQGLYAMGWQTAGVYPQALTPYYNDFMGPTSEDMDGWQSEVGQRLLSNYGLISLISAGGKRFLPTDGSQGLGYWTFDNQSYTTTKAQINILKDRPGHGLVLAVHPKNIGLSGMMSFADFIATLDYVKQLWDAGTIEVVTQSGMAFADPGTSRRLDLLTDNSFDGGTTTSSWGLVGGALRETTGGRTGANFLRLPAGTGAYAAQGPGQNLRTWGGHGMVFMLNAWARNSSATDSVGARVLIYANTPGGNITLRDVTTTLPASSPWTRLRVPVGVPKDATNVVVQLMRSGLGTVDYDDVSLYAC